MLTTDHDHQRTSDVHVYAHAWIVRGCYELPARRPDAIMSKFVVMAGWDDVPHLDEQTKQDLYASIPPYQRDARSKGIPQLGSGAIYPVPESEIVCKPFEIPRYWPRAYALDVGWNRTAAIWGAW